MAAAPAARSTTTGSRVAQLARHELAVAFAGARLREALERERHELGAIVDGATDLILQVDDERRVVRLNPAGERLLGVDRGRRDRSVVRRRARLRGRRRPRRGEPARSPRCARPARPIALPRDAPIRGATGEPVQVAGSYAPAPAGAAAPSARPRSCATSAPSTPSTSCAKGFVATVSHELRTPLALIRGYAETLLHLELDHRSSARYVERIDEATGRLPALVDEVLDVTHLQADPLILERSPRPSRPSSRGCAATSMSPAAPTGWS